MMRLLVVSMLLLATACGLADNPRDEENKYIYITFSDPAFRDYCLREFDSSHDGRLSRYEAQRVRRIDCPDLGIATMWEIGDFSNLQILICNDNRIAQLDLRKCVALQQVSCDGNDMRSLDVEELRNLTSLSCANNALTGLTLETNTSLRTLICSSNDLTILDVSACSRVMDQVDASECPLTVFYKASAQQIRTLRLDNPSVVKDR